MSALPPARQALPGPSSLPPAYAPPAWELYIQTGGDLGPMVLLFGVLMSTGPLMRGGGRFLVILSVTVLGAVDAAVTPGIPPVDAFAAPESTAIRSMGTPAYWVIAVSARPPGPPAAGGPWPLVARWAGRRWQCCFEGGGVPWMRVLLQSRRQRPSLFLHIVALRLRWRSTWQSLLRGNRFGSVLRRNHHAVSCGGLSVPSGAASLL
ncbi:MAG: hypothetical protein HW404_1297 [Anaerolineales bacterium]|nr:hypothetical protein [Anaerolineales bacterium]